MPRTGDIDQGPVQASLLGKVVVKENRGFSGKWKVFLLRIGERPRHDVRPREGSPGEEVAEDAAGRKDKRQRDS